MKYEHLGTAGILVTGVLFAAGCGSSSSSGNTAQTPTSATTAASRATTSASSAQTPAPNASTAGGPCDLVTHAEAEGAVGAPLGTVKVTTIPPDSYGLGLALCQYTRPSGELVFAGLYSYTGTITSALFNQFKQTKAGATAVSGVGDEAFETRGTNSGEITFRKGSKAASVLLAANRFLEKNLLDLARTAAGRL